METPSIVIHHSKRSFVKEAACEALRVNLSGCMAAINMDEHECRARDSRDD